MRRSGRNQYSYANALESKEKTLLSNDSKQVLKGSLKNVVAAISATLIVNLTDSARPIYSADWFRHVAFASSVLILMLEARYWYKWATNGGNLPNDPKNINVP
jgi:hypothetical protein